LVNTLPITLVELLAAVAVTAYYRAKPGRDRPSLWLMRFLWLTVGVELTANYAAIAYFSDYRYFGLVEGTVFSSNYWLYNVLILITVGFYAYYFSAYYSLRSWRRFIGLLVVVYFLTSVINLWYSEEFFSQYVTYSFLMGSGLIFLSIVLFFVDMLQKDNQVNLKYYLPFYIAAGALVVYISLAPLTIYSKYFNEENTQFVSFHAQLLVIVNLLMYITYFIGALVCKKNSSY